MKKIDVDEILTLAECCKNRLPANGHGMDVVLMMFSCKDEMSIYAKRKWNDPSFESSDYIKLRSIHSPARLRGLSVNDVVFTDAAVRVMISAAISERLKERTDSEIMREEGHP